MRFGCLMLLLTVLSCAGASMPGPGYEDISSLALVGMHANRRVYEADGHGQITGWSRQEMHEVSEETLRAWREELARLGWRVKPPEEVRSHDAYKGFLAAPGRSVGSTKGFFAPEGIWVAEDFDPDRPGDLKTLTALARALDVDAVAVIGVDFVYDSRVSAFSSGFAHMTAASRAMVVDREGRVSLDTGRLLPGDMDAPDRAASETTMPMVLGSIVLGETDDARTLVRMFREAARANAAKAVELIRERVDG